MRTTLSAGIAIFSMFFGAGNVVFPLALGRLAGDQIGYALLGLLVTAVGGPLLGLLGATMFHGDCRAFFTRTGRSAGYLMMLLALGLLGPFAVMPRCITVTYAALQPIFPALELSTLSFLFGLVALLCCMRKHRILSILGLVLSPVLLICLVTIIFRGAAADAVAPSSSLVPAMAVREGLFVGYDTMDLIAALFFSATIWHMLDHRLTAKGLAADTSAIFKHTLAAGLIGGSLLALVYIGLSHVTAQHAAFLADTAPENLMTTVAYATLGPIYGTIANLAIALACLTTVVSLAITIVRLIEHELEAFDREIPHLWLLVGTLAITTVFANFGFATLMVLIHPLVALCYPAIIVLTLCNILHKLYGWNRVKLPVLATLATTAVFQLLGH